MGQVLDITTAEAPGLQRVTGGDHRRQFVLQTRPACGLTRAVTRSPAPAPAPALGVYLGAPVIIDQACVTKR
jgi:hypothetical protein